MRLGSLSVTSLLRAPSKQHISLQTVSGWHMGAWVPLRRESPTTITCHLFLVALVVHGEQIGLHHLAPASLPTSFLFSLQSREAVLQGHLRLWGKSSCWSLSLQASILLHYWAFPCVCVGGGVFGCLAMGCGSTADCTWNQLSIYFSVSLMFCSLLTTSCCSGTCCRSSSPWTHLQQAGLPPIPAPGERSKLCTAPSPFSSSVCVISNQ